MANTLGLGPSARKGLRVQVPPSAPEFDFQEFSQRILPREARKGREILARRLETLKKVAKALEVSVDELIS